MSPSSSAYREENCDILDQLFLGMMAHIMVLRNNLGIELFIFFAASKIDQIGESLVLKKPTTTSPGRKGH